MTEYNDFFNFESTPRYSYARERSPLWSNYSQYNLSTHLTSRADPVEQKRLAHLATPTIFTESRLQRSRNFSHPTSKDSASKHAKSKDQPKCLNCGLRGHSIINCDKISRFSELNCHDPMSNSEDVLFRQSRLSSYDERPETLSGSVNIRKEMPSEFNSPKLPLCRLCGLKGHSSASCQNFSPSTPTSFSRKMILQPLNRRLSNTESPYSSRRKWDLFNYNSDTESLSDPPLGSVINVYDDLRSPLMSRSTMLTPMKAKSGLHTILDEESSITSKTLPSRFKAKRVRIDSNLEETSKNGKWRSNFVGCETDTDSGLGFGSSSEHEGNPNDVFEMLENSIKEFEKEFQELSIKSENGVESTNRTANSSDPIRKENSSPSKEKPDKKMLKLRVKFLKTWFKKSVQN